MIAFLNGSPKAAGSTTEKLLLLLQECLADETIISLSARTLTFDNLADCETLVIAFPLYVDGLPSHLLRYLEAYAAACPKAKRVYALAHCGFYEGKQCHLALEMVAHFCAHTRMTYAGGAALGAALLTDTLPAPLTKPFFQTLETLAQAIRTKQALLPEAYAQPKMPRRMYICAGNFRWRQEAKHNGLSPKVLYWPDQES